MLIGLPIAILYFLARKITAEGAEERYKHLTIYSPSAPLSRTLRLNSLFGYSNACPSGMASIESFPDSIMPHVPGSSCIVKSPDSGFGYLSSYLLTSKHKPTPQDILTHAPYIRTMLW